jgi:hypothetical protein
MCIILLHTHFFFSLKRKEKDGPKEKKSRVAVATHCASRQ